MPKKTNSEVVEEFIKVLVEKMSRRTSEGFAVVTLRTILNKLIPKYDFLNYIKVKRTFYSEGIDAVSVSSELNKVNSEKINQSLNKVLTLTVKHLEQDADYFFIKEIKQEIEEIHPNLLDDIETDLNLMQTKYLIRRQEEQKIDNKEITGQIISILASLINKILPEKKTINTLIDVIEELQEKHYLFHYIKIQDKASKDGFYNLKIDDNIRDILLKDLGRAFKDLIQEIVSQIEWKEEKSFTEFFKDQLSKKQLLKIKKMGINLDDIKPMIQRKKNDLIMKKSLDALIRTVGDKTSIGFAVITLEKIINNQSDEYKLLNYIKIDKTDYSQGSKAISISSEVNNVDPYICGKTINYVIKMTGKNTGDKVHNFIDYFRKELGEEYQDEIEKIGVNLHLLDLKFT